MGEESMPGAESKTGAMAADDPIGSLEEDALGRGPFVAQVAELIGGVDDLKSSTVFGLVAPWGAGKTSLLSMIRHELDQRGWAVVEFNPWELGDLQGLTREFIASLAAGLPDGKKGAKAREALRKYGRRAGSLASLVNVPGLDVGKLLDAVLEAAEPDESLAALRHQLEQRLEKIETPILLVIDDIDRLQSDELLTLLKLVRVVGRLPRVSYLLAYDEATLTGVLKRSGMADDAGRAQNYLEKIVQIRIDVPPAHVIHRSEMVDGCLARIGERHGLALDADEDRRFGILYYAALSDVLTGPRQIKRYFAQLEAFLPLVAGEVDFVDFAIMTALRTFFPGLYAALPTEKAELTSTEAGLHRMKPEEARARWEELVARYVAPGQASIAQALLAEVFRPVPSPESRMSSGPGSSEELLQRMGVGSYEYFDRYFFLGVPPDDISDTEVRRIIDGVLEGRTECTGEVVALLENPHIAETLVRKLYRFSPTNGPSAKALLPLAAQIASTAPRTGFLEGAAGAARAWLGSLFELAHLDEPDALLEQMLSASSVLDVGWAFVRSEASNADLPRKPEDRAAFREALLNAVRRELDAATQERITSTPDLPGLLSVWAAIESDDVVRNWFQKASSVSPWSVEDAASVFVERRRFLGADVWRLGGFDRERADRQLGLDFIVDATADLVLDVNESPAPLDWFDDVPDTEAERLKRTHAAIAQLRRQGGSEDEGG